MGSLKNALLSAPRMRAALGLLWTALSRWYLIMCYLFLMMALMALVVVGWIHDTYDDDAT